MAPIYNSLSRCRLGLSGLYTAHPGLGSLQSAVCSYHFAIFNRRRPGTDSQNSKGEERFLVASMLFSFACAFGCGHQTLHKGPSMAEIRSLSSLRHSAESCLKKTQKKSQMTSKCDCVDGCYYLCGETSERASQ